MINWQPPQTAPKDTSCFVVQTVLGDIEGWTYNQRDRCFHVLHIPGGGNSIKTTTSTIARWARWNELFDLIRAIPARF